MLWGGAVFFPPTVPAEVRPFNEGAFAHKFELSTR